MQQNVEYIINAHINFGSKTGKGEFTSNIDTYVCEFGTKRVVWRVRMGVMWYPGWDPWRSVLSAVIIYSIAASEILYQLH